eukprot:TRINITY_DN15756_c0_g1_i5.p1 TRINITY_DN15756_c0_g1~~TRINITY_DN15756_c0_g1_i5.p1  ORF type:complete len:340 (-),score=73.01 TRINITY_DN15756_c0_g1_i5:37-1056(-)
MGQGHTKRKSSASASAISDSTTPVTPDAQPKSVKVLLLGGASSGKSSIFLHLRSLEDEDTHDDVWTIFLRNNLVESMTILLSHMDRNHQRLSPEFQLLAQSIHHLHHEHITSDHLESVKTLWAIPQVKTACAEFKTQLHLIENIEYLFDNIDRYLSVDFKISFEDKLRVRRRTTGIVEQSFTFRDQKFMLIDVGGSRGERKKWIHCFANVDLILYVVGISEFNQTLFEDSYTARIKDSYDTFRDVVQSPWFIDTKIILVFNKVDLLEKKLQNGIQVSDFFPEFQGDNNSREEVLEFFNHLFQERADKYPHSIPCIAISALSAESIRQLTLEMTQVIRQP